MKQGIEKEILESDTGEESIIITLPSINHRKLFMDWLLHEGEDLFHKSLINKDLLPFEYDEPNGIIMVNHGLNTMQLDVNLTEESL